MFKKVVSFILVIVLTLSVVPTLAANNAKAFSDVPSGYWGKASIDYISEKGYMVGYGDKFGILDNITEGQYVAVLCRIFGYEKQSPLTCEEPARELGLLKENETINVTANLKREDIAKYTVRAFELLNPNATYPDYLEAYSGLITDYDSLKEELRPIALKCVEKGLLAGDLSGRFNPEDETTRAQAAAFIYRILEESERDKIKPVFAIPDKEFEDFMNSSEASNYIYIKGIDKVINGKIIWKSLNDGTTRLLPIYNFKNSNKVAYELLKNLVNFCRKNNYFIQPNYFESATQPFVKIIFYPYSKYANSEFRNFEIELYPEGNVLDGNSQINRKYRTDIYWDFVALNTGHKIMNQEEYEACNGFSDEFIEPIQLSMKTIYGEEIGNYLCNYFINEWNKSFDSWYYNNGTYNRQDNIYISKYDLEIQNYSVREKDSPKFGTNYIYK